MKTIILDIETKPKESLKEHCIANIKPKGSLKDPIKIEADIKSKKDALHKKMACDSDLCEIDFIGVKELGQDSQLMLLEEFAKYMNCLPESFRLVTFNGKKFDLPIILKEGARKGVDLMYQELLHCTKRYDTTHHVDLMEILSFGDISKVKSKDELAKIYLDYDAEPIDFETCTTEELEEHCLEDLEVTERLYELFNGKLY